VAVSQASLRSEAGEAQRRAEAQRQQTVEQRDTALYNLYIAHMLLAHKDWQHGHTDRMIDLVNSHPASRDRPDFRGWEWHYLNSLTSKEIATLSHSSPVYEDALAWSPDGRYLAVGGKMISIWDIQSRKRLRTFEGKESLFDRPSPVAWSPDGQRLACDPNHTVEIWDPIKGKKVNVLGKLPRAIFDIVWSPDGKYVAAGGDADNAVRVWHVQNGGDPLLLRGQVEMVWSLGWHPHGRYLAVGDTYRGRLEIWDVVDQELVRSFLAHRLVISSTEWSPDGDRLATGSHYGTVKLWDPETWTATTTITAHRGFVESVSWSPDGKWLASSGADNMVKVWNSTTGILENRLGGHRACVYDVAWSTDGHVLASGDQHGRVKLWRPFDRQESISIEGKHRVAWSPDGRSIVAPRVDAGVAVIDATTGREIRELLGPRGAKFRERSEFRDAFGCAWSSDGALVAVCTKSGTLGTWDAPSGKNLWLVPLAHGTDEATSQAWQILSVSFNPVDHRVATTGMDGTVRIWGPTTGGSVHTIGNLDWGGSVLWSPDGQSLAHADWYGALKVWKVEDWRVVHDLRLDSAGHEDNGQYTIAWSPDGGRLAGGFARGQIVVWDMKTGHQLVSFRGHAASIRSISWSPDGSRLASGSRDRTARVWDAETGRELITFDAGAIVHAVAWSPEGHRLAVAPVGMSAQIYDATWSYENTE
jgi:WD40 repeat protein